MKKVINCDETYISRPYKQEVYIDLIFKGNLFDITKNDYFDDNKLQLKDKFNKEFFPNADITKIWD